MLRKKSVLPQVAILRPFDDSDDEEIGGVSGQWSVVSGLGERRTGGRRPGDLDRGIERAVCAAEGAKVTNEAKFYDDVIGAQIPEIVDVVADPGGDLGIDALRTKPKFGEVSGQLLDGVSGQLGSVVSRSEESGGGGGATAMASGGDCGARAGVAGPDQRGGRFLVGRRGGRGGRRNADSMK